VRGLVEKAAVPSTRRASAPTQRIIETGVGRVAFDGEDDHVHVLVAYSPKVAVTSLVNSLKGASSCLVRAKQSFPEVRQRGGHF
jgi:putative transposase